MRLLLTVLGSQRSTLADRSTRMFDEAGGTIGRSASCDWVLPDEKHLLSARHARISHNGRGFLITDTSTNGVYLNAVDAPLGREQSAPLANGDTLYAADYIISVAILPDEPRLAAPVASGLPIPTAASVPAPLPAAQTMAALPPAADLAPPAMAPAAIPPAPAPPRPTIPDDFDFGGLVAPVPAAVTRPPVAPPEPGLSAAEAPPAAEPPAPSPRDALALLRQRAEVRAASMDLSPLPARPEPAAAMPPPAPRPDALAIALPGAGRAELGDAAVFWTALGIDGSRIPPEARDRMLAELGGALREAARGLVAVLSARRSMKDEFRVDLTRLAPSENNPFKFFASGDEALGRVVADGAPGFLPLDFAVRQGFDDIQAHELALTASVQAGIRNLLARLAPEAIEREAEPGALGRRPDKGRLWERYGELHSGLSNDLDRTIRDLVADAFALPAGTSATGTAL